MHSNPLAAHPEASIPAHTFAHRPDFSRRALFCAVDDEVPWRVEFVIASPFPRSGANP